MAQINSKESKYTIECEDPSDYKYGAPNHFYLVPTDEGEYSNIISSVNMQVGPVNEVGVNGFKDEDLLEIVLFRLIAFQNTDYNCDLNDKAINGITQALTALHLRHINREIRGVEGTSKI